jgi:hypothetical protein
MQIIWLTCCYKYSIMHDSAENLTERHCGPQRKDHNQGWFSNLPEVQGWMWGCVEPHGNVSTRDASVTSRIPV